MKRRYSTRPLTVAALGVVLLIALALMSESARDSARFGALYSALFLVNVTGLLALIALIGINLKRLVSDLRKGAPGVRLKLRMVGTFVTLSVIPVLIVYGFSIDFLRRGIDSWFDVRVEQALNDSLELSQRSLELRMRETLRSATEMAAELAGGMAVEPGPLNLEALRNPDATIVANVFNPGAAELDALRVRSGAEELALLDQNGNMLAASSSATEIVPHLPNRAILLQLGQGRDYVGLDPVRNSGLYIRIAVNVARFGLGGDRQILHGLFPVAGRLSNLADSVEVAFAKYTELMYLRDRLKLSFIMTLTLVLMFGVFMAIWAVLHFADLLAAPIRDLAQGTRAVAEGNYATSLPVSSYDELGFLVDSFNDMTRRVAKARDEVVEQRRYLETVLSKLSSGVLTLDSRQAVIVVNDAAGHILGVDSAQLVNRTLKEIAADNRVFQSFLDAIGPHLASPQVDWQEQAVVFGDRRKILMCRGTRLPGEEGGAADAVIVFDDITALVQGQREAAWSDVARRLAHEIKNPLTPIQLAAERLRRKYLHDPEADEHEVLDRLTSTIIQQVETMKGMVNTFTDYARPPNIRAEPVDLHALIGSIVELFRTANPGARIELQFDDAAPLIKADPNRLRQVFNNLIKNALEAAPAGQAPQVTIATRNFDDSPLHYIEVKVTDRGSGIDAALIDDVFEPYVTSKPKGTGLGLAIVKKIVEEHGGVVSLENVEGGACATVRLPRQFPAVEAGVESKRYFA